MVIQGEMSAFRDILLPLQVRNGKSSEVEDVSAVLDTGFNGHLTMPSKLIQTLALQPEGLETVTLADGTERELNSYKATILWQGRERTVPVYEAQGDPLIGVALIYGMVGTFHFSDGGAAILFRT